MLQKLHTIMFVYQLMLTKILRFDVSLEKFCGALKDNFNSARKFWGNEGNLGTSPKITKNHENLHFLCRAEYPHTSRSLTRPRYVLGTSSLHFRILQKILKRFKKKSWKNIENFWSKIDFKNVDFENFRKIKIFMKNFRKIGKSEFFEKIEKSKKVGFSLIFSKNRKIEKIEKSWFSKIFEINIFEIYFRSKIFNIFSWFFFKPL